MRKLGENIPFYGIIIYTHIWLICVANMSEKSYRTLMEFIANAHTIIKRFCISIESVRSEAGYLIVASPLHRLQPFPTPRFDDRSLIYRTVMPENSEISIIPNATVCANVRTHSKISRPEYVDRS